MLLFLFNKNSIKKTERNLIQMLDEIIAILFGTLIEADVRLSRQLLLNLPITKKLLKIHFIKLILPLDKMTFMIAE